MVYSSSVEMLPGIAMPISFALSTRRTWNAEKKKSHEQIF